MCPLQVESECSHVFLLFPIEASIEGICKFLTAGPLDPETEVVVAVPAVYMEYVRGKLGEGIGVAAQVNTVSIPCNNARAKRVRIVF